MHRSIIMILILEKLSNVFSMVPDSMNMMKDCINDVIAKSGFSESGIHAIICSTS